MYNWTVEFYIHIDETIKYHLFEEIKLGKCKILLHYLIVQCDVGRQINSLARKPILYKKKI